MRTGLQQALRLLEPLADRDGVYFDVLVGGLTNDEYELLPGGHETLDVRDGGELVFAKDIHLPGGTVTVETSYERVAA